MHVPNRSLYSYNPPFPNLYSSYKYCIHAVGTGAETWQNLSFAKQQSPCSAVQRSDFCIDSDLKKITFQLFDFWCYPKSP
jgi:hypothetical protein